jgi:hypothetical protein
MEKKRLVNEYAGGNMIRSTYTEENGTSGTIFRKLISDYTYSDNAAAINLFPIYFSAETGELDFYNPWYGKSPSSKVPSKIKMGIYDGNSVLAEEYTFQLSSQVEENGSVSRLNINTSTLSGDANSVTWFFDFDCL